METIRLDRLLHEQEIRSPVIKVDVEGFEPDVIEGAGVLLQDPEAAMILEFIGPTMAASLGHGAALRLFRTMSDNGLVAFAISEHGLTAVEEGQAEMMAADLLFIRPASARFERIASLLL